VLHLQRRDVDGDPQPIGPARCLGAGLAQQMLGKPRDQPVLLGGMNSAGEITPRSGYQITVTRSSE
jgi:hypothetical protein